MAGGDLEEFCFLVLPFESNWPEHSAHLRAGPPEPRRAVGSTSPTTMETSSHVLAAAGQNAGSLGPSELWEPQQVQRALKSISTPLLRKASPHLHHTHTHHAIPPTPPRKQEPFPATLGKVKRRWQEEAERGPHLSALSFWTTKGWQLGLPTFYLISTLCPDSRFLLSL